MPNILTFSCLHLATPSVQQVIHDGNLFDYKNLPALIELCKKADIVINLGDLAEPNNDFEALQLPQFQDIIAILNDPKVYMILGNHDKWGGQTKYPQVFPKANMAFDGLTIAGWRFIHGHTLLAHFEAATREDYAKALWKHARATPTICGHTHIPHIESALMDVGSITKSGTVGWLIDGVPQLEYV